MRRHKRILSLMIVTAIVLGAGVGVYASDTPTEKEEIVYALLNCEGNVNNIYVVNKFGTGSVIDYGDYTHIRNLTTSDAIRYDGDMVSVMTQSDELYYEGELVSKVLPWLFSVKYYIDDVAYLPEDILGKSGKLKIEIIIAQNPDADQSFFENYPLQVSVTLNSDRFTHVESAGATFANSGADQLLSYIIFPKDTVTIDITADVATFEIAPVEISALRLNLADSLDINAETLGLSNYEEFIVDLQEGAGDLNSGAHAIKRGISEFADGAGQLADGAEDLYAGLGALAQGNSALAGGIEDLVGEVFYAASRRLGDAIGLTADPGYPLTRQTYISQLKNLAVAEIQAKLVAMGAANDPGVQAIAMTIAYDHYIANGGTVNAALNDAVNNLDLTVLPDADKIDKLCAAYLSESNDLGDLKRNLDGVLAYEQGLETYTDGVASSAAGAKAVASGADDLNDGAEQLLSGASELAAGTNELEKQTAEFDPDISGEIQDKIDGVIMNYKDDQFTPISFVSQKNTNVKSVQFIIKIDGIQFPEAQAAEIRDNEKQGFWQKLKALFSSGE